MPDPASRTAAVELAPPLDADRSTLEGPFGRVELYSASTAARETPLLLVHSVNAAASAYEVRPLFEHYRRARPVHALDLPGFGLSERSDRRYTPRLMTDAVIAVAERIVAGRGGAPIDALAISLGSEFVARAAVRSPALFRSVALVSPTGFDRRAPYAGADGSDRGKPWLLAALGKAPWSDAFFRGLTRPAVIRWFLEKTWGGKRIDEGLLAYDILTTRARGASRAPFYFVAGFLFSADITRVYERLALPVWMLHGTRGDFVDYADAKRYAARSNWSIESLEGGALPHFERPARFVERYDAFLARLRDLPERASVRSTAP